MTGKKRKRHIGLKIFLGLILLLVLGGIVFRNQIVKKAESVVAKKVVEQVLDAKIASDSETGEEISGQDILNSMDEADQEKVEEIITENLTQENIEAAKSYIQSGDVSGAKEYAKEALSEEDQETLTNLYEKYKDQLAQ